jgi:lipopolysaccharide transport system ATP-binding protein
MSDTVITAEHLSKSYLVGHQRSEQGPYIVLRDVIASGVRSFVRKGADFFAGRQIIQGDEIEEFWALKDVDFEIREGEVFGIIGHNGAGKSTLLKILSRITEPTDGEVRIKGRVASLLEVGTGFHPELTGRENIYLNGAVLGMTRQEIRRKFDEIVAFADVERFLDTPVKRFSSGMYVRLAFAVAAHLEPEILLIDEVLAVGDADFQKKCLGKIDDVARSGRTILFVSHNMNAIERLCRRVMWMGNGRVEGVYDDVRAGVSAYLRGTASGARKIWMNSGKEYQSEYLIPQRFEVFSLNNRGNYVEAFSNDHPVQILIDLIVLRADPAQNVGIALYDENDQMIFCSYSSDGEEDHWPKIEVGRTTLSTAIPQRFLNEGNYRLELLAGLHHRAWLLEPRTNVPTVMFTIRGGLSNSPYWDHKRTGILAPVLDWKNLVVDEVSALQASS